MKNKTLRRGLCVLLAILMVFGTLTVGALAVEDKTQLPALSLVDVLAA